MEIFVQLPNNGETRAGLHCKSSKMGIGASVSGASLIKVVLQDN